jgi:chromate reductase
MASPLKVLAFAGSSRRGSYNGMLVEAAALMAEARGAAVTRLNLRDLDLPIFDEDLEQEFGHPENVLTLKRLFIEHDAMLISCPEYNGMITPLLKNAIDWASRPREGEAPLACFKGKTVGLLAASPGALGGMRGLIGMRTLLCQLGCFVCPTQHALPMANQAFNTDGTLKDAKTQAAVERVVEEALRLGSALMA